MINIIMGMKKLLNNWRYLGLGRNDYEMCLINTLPDNLINLFKANIMVCSLAVIFTVVRYFINSGDYLSMGIYFGTGVIALIQLFFIKKIINQHKKGKHISKYLIYSLIIIYYLNIIFFGIYLGVWANPGKIAGAFLCILVCALFLFDIPVILNTILIISAALVFMAICFIVKSPDNWSIDWSNAVFAMIIGLYFSWHIVKFRMAKSLLSSEAEAANKAKSIFLANMSHEIRTPMNSIIGFSELAMYDKISPKTKDYLTKIHKNSEWLLQLLNDILDISKIEAGKMDVENTPFNPQEIFVACRTMIMPKAIEKGLSMHFYIEPTAGKKLYGDPIKLHQALVNLLSNAVKFTETGTVKMLGTILNCDENNVKMYFEVKDTGIGITDEQLKKIFDPFIQAEAGTTRKFGGSGLGLVITKNLIEMMGGALKVESVPGTGSKFSFELNFNAVTIDNEKENIERFIFDDSSEKPVFEGEVLLCEDNIMNQQVICEHLAQVGLKTELAINGEQGVAMIQKRLQSGKKQYDLIFMDIHMPVMDGIEATEKILSLTSKIPIVAMTANVMAYDRDIYLAAGMSDCVSKPFTSQVLWRCLLKYFKPLKIEKEDPKEKELVKNNLHQELINLFVKNCRERYDEINDALSAGDIKLAHRLAHSLKSNAGQLNKTALMQSAGVVENALKNEKNLVTQEQMENLKKRLNDAIEDLEPLARKIEKPSANPVSANISALQLSDQDAKQAIHELIEKLEPLLKNGNPECLTLVNEIQILKGSEKLIEQMENFDFDHALNTLEEIKKNIGII